MSIEEDGMSSMMSPMDSQSVQPAGSAGTGSRKKFPDNIPGRYYVLDNCNACGLCKSIADSLFDFNTDGTYYFVSRQPVTKDEQSLMDEAIEFCTVNGIWWDDREIH